MKHFSCKYSVLSFFPVASDWTYICMECGIRAYGITGKEQHQDVGTFGSKYSGYRGRGTDRALPVDALTGGTDMMLAD